MILSILRYFRGLPVHHRWTIFITILLPVIWPLVIAYIARDLVLQAVLHVAVFLVWSVIAVVALASTLKKDRSEAEQLVAQQGEALSDRISGLRGEHEDSRADLWQQVADLEEALRSTLKGRVGGRSSTSAGVSPGQGRCWESKGVCHFDCRRGEQAGASTTEASTRDALVLESGLRKSGSQLSLAPLPLQLGSLAGAPPGGPLS